MERGRTVVELQQRLSSERDESSVPQRSDADSLSKPPPACVSSPRELEERRPGPSVHYASPAHITSHPPNLLCFPAPVQKHITPVTLFADAAPSFLLRPGLNPWPVVVPGPSGARQQRYTAVVSGSSAGVHADGSVQDCFRLWQRLCETARLFCCAPSDAGALACFFM